MMASLHYLWRHRAKFSLLNILFYKAWAKRILTLRELRKRNRRRKKLTNKGACIAQTAEIGNIKADGNKSNLKIGDFSFIGRVELALHERITIGSRVCINDGVTILTASHHLNDPSWNHKKAPIVIKDYAWICTNAILLPGVSIGRGAVVGAGAVVSKNVGDFEIVVGNPAKAIEKKRTQDLDYNPCAFLAANNAWING
jgi:maltose O-acetyltransferase